MTNTGDSSQNSATSISLIDQARLDEPDAWHQLMNAYSPLVLSWARRGRLQPEDAADIAQDVFRIVVANLERFKKEKPNDSFRGWLWTITRNEVRGYYRKKAKARDVAFGGTDAQNQMAAVPDWVVEDDSTEEIEADPAAETELIRRTADLIRQDFQEHTWKAFWLSAVEGHTTEAIAVELNMKPGAIRQAKLRVLKRFREVLDS